MWRPTAGWRAALCTAMLGVFAAAAGASVGVPPGGATAGYDVSYPLCGLPLPVGGAFAIVGVNGGLANNANPCLAGELAWAAATAGLASPPVQPLSLYLNTADPGNGVADWPTPTNGSATASTPFGACDGSWSPACSYLYGTQRAAYGYQLATLAAGAAGAPSSLAWWLDIETQSSWAKPTDQAGWAGVNVAAIRGFVAGLRAAGVTGPIGYYSTAIQWSAITGPANASGAGALDPGAPDWVAGAGSAAQAQGNCANSFSGGPVKLAQFVASGLDGDVACLPALAPRLRILVHAVRGGRLSVSGTIDPSYAGRVVVELSASYHGADVRVRRSATVAAGRWQVVLALPRRRPLRAAVVGAQSHSGDGLLAGAALVHVRLPA